MISTCFHTLAVDGTRNDFDNTVQQITFPPNPANAEQILTINLIDDTINEAQEGFYVMIRVVQSGPTDQITFVRNGVALIRITDNDRKYQARNPYIDPYAPV